MRRVSFPSASSVPYAVGVKKAPMPAPAARMRSASVPWGTSSSSISPARYALSKCQESLWRGNEHRIFFTRFLPISAASPASALPALLFTTVRSFAPCARSASISCAGMPALPKPPIMIVAPSGTSASASSAVAMNLSIMAARLAVRAIINSAPMPNLHVFQAAPLARAIEAIVAAGGSEPREAKIVAENLVTANLTGHDSHGIGLMPRYVEALLEGGLHPNRQVEVKLDGGSLLALDGGAGYGQSIGLQATRMAVERARKHGISIT